MPFASFLYIHTGIYINLFLSLLFLSRSSFHSNNALFITFRDILKAPKCLKPTIRWCCPLYLGSRALSTNGTPLPWIEGYGDKIIKNQELSRLARRGAATAPGMTWQTVTLHSRTQPGMMTSLKVATVHLIGIKKI